MDTLIILNDPPYGTERSDNGLRLAFALTKREGERLKVFFMGDASSCAKKGQRTPTGYYNLESMLKGIVGHGGVAGVCGSCMDARGITVEELAEGAHRSNMDELADWTTSGGRVLIF